MPRTESAARYLAFIRVEVEVDPIQMEQNYDTLSIYFELLRYKGSTVHPTGCLRDYAFIL